MNISTCQNVYVFTFYFYHHTEKEPLKDTNLKIMFLMLFLVSGICGTVHACIYARTCLCMKILLLTRVNLKKKKT